MKQRFIITLLLLLFLLFALFSSSLSQLVSLNHNKNKDSYYYTTTVPARRSRSLLSLPHERATALVATLDGTINLVDPVSEKVIWSHATGVPIYSSFHTPIKHNSAVPGALYYVDCGDDWMVYARTQFGKMKLDKSIREFVVNTPHVSEDGGIMNGAMKTTVFLLDVNTGRRIHTYGVNESDDLQQIGLVDLKTGELPLHITRTDYKLSYVSAKFMWNLTVSEIGATFLCQDFENSISGSHSSSGYELPSELPVQFSMPLPCQSKAIVARLCSCNVSDYFYHDDMMLPTPSSDHIPPFQPKVDKRLDLVDAEPLRSLPRLPNELEISGPDVNYSYRRFSLISFVLIIVGILIYSTLLQGESNKTLNTNDVSSKRKKNLKSIKNGDSVEKKDRRTSTDLEDGYSALESDKKLFLNFNQLIDDCKDGRTIGKLFVTKKEIAKGSNGTIVLEGIYEGRPVAVKRLVKAHHDVAFKEIQNLIASDKHSNIVRWYGVEYDQDFVYLALERCTCSLNDLIWLYSGHHEKSEYIGAQASRAMTEYIVQLDSVKGILQDIELWKSNGYPSPMLLKLMRNVVSGLAHLHELGIIHRDLKPQNVLIVKERSLSAKISDMGISKRLVGDMSSLGHLATGFGSSGWQAPEQLLHGRQTRAVDLFSLGCVLFYCITGGKHPFGDPLERDINITKNKIGLSLVEFIPEAVDLFSRLLDPVAERRPTALDVLHHPLFWNSEMRLSFLRDTSDRVELEDREVNSDILKSLESVAPTALGGKWDEKMEPAFIADIRFYRRYKFDSVRDLLRVIRNKLNHYRELPMEIQELLGPVPEGFDDYFGSRFPKLLIQVYNVMTKYCKHDEWFRKYSNSNVV